MEYAPEAFTPLDIFPLSDFFYLIPLAFPTIISTEAICIQMTLPSP